MKNNIYFCEKPLNYDNIQELDSENTVIDSYISKIEGLSYEYDFGETIYLN